MTRRRPLTSSSALAALAMLALASAAPGEQEKTPSFSTEASAITVDVVVLDGEGQPVRGLARDDFTVREDGQKQSLVGFEARDVDIPDTRRSEPGRGELSQVTTDNASSTTSPGRVFALLIDDRGISPPVASQLKPALAAWIREKADPGDEITLSTTSGELWWSDVVSRGRGDLLTVLDRLEGRRLGGPGERAGGMSEWEAYRIVYVEGDGLARAERIARDVVGAPGQIQFLGSSALERVLQRWYDSRLCDPEYDPVERCISRIQVAANEVHHDWRLRAESVYASVARLSRSLQGIRGRKSILLISEDFIQDDSLDRPFRDAIDASQRANTALYFLGARGLTGLSAFSVARDVPVRSQDIGMLAAEEGILATAGAETLAEATGGALTRSNDLTDGLERMARDSTTYYLLGYQPQGPPDGKWHDLRVEVSRPGVTVLARKGYLAARPETGGEVTAEPAVEKTAGGDDEDSKRPLDPALLTGSARDGLPLRLAAYVRNNDGVSKARVRVVLEVDNSRVHVDRRPTPWRATLDLTVLAAGLDRPPRVPFDERLHMSLTPEEVTPGWWLVTRDVWLPAGVTQLRVFVKDVLSGSSGLVTLRLVVPDVSEPYLSTPLLTDRALPMTGGATLPRLVPAAHRRFTGRRPLYCQYEVFIFGGQSLKGVPRLLASYLLQGPDGRVVSADQPTLIETDGKRAVRRIVLPSRGLENGPHVLAITVEDRLAGHTLTARVPFEIEKRREEPARTGTP